MIGLLVLIGGVILAACTQAPAPQAAPGAAGSKAVAPASEVSGRLVFATLASGTSYYQVTVGLTTILNKYSKLETTPQPYPNSRGQFELIENGEVQVGMSHTNELYEAWQGVPKSQGIGFFEGKPRPWVRILFSGNRLYYGWTTRKDTGIKTVPDLKGRKVIGNFPTQLSSTLSAQAELRAYGIDPQKDVTMITADSSVVAIDKLIDKSADASFGSVGGAKLQELDTAVGSYIVPFDAGKIDVVAKAVPGIVAVTIPGKIPGAHVDTPGVALVNELFVHKDTDEKLAYTIVKTILEHQQELAPMGAEASEWNREGAVRFPTQSVPYHPGAVKYFKEIGIWTQEMEARQNDLLKQ